MNHRQNVRIAARLRQMAELLEHQGEQGFRSLAYRRAARVIEGLDKPLNVLLSEGGSEALVELPAVGRAIAAAITEMVTTGHWQALDRLTGALDPVALLMTVPGLGRKTATRIRDSLGIETLEELEEAANDGRLVKVSGVGERRLAALQASLQERLQTLRSRIRYGRLPPVALLLEVDEIYRRKAANNELKLIAPRRFNPDRRPWLPVLHEHREGWHFTALFSNSARAHQLGRSRDWVIVHVMHDKAPDWQCTIVTETRGSMKGRRVIRGREPECERFHRAIAPA